MEYEVKLIESSKALSARDKIRFNNFSAALTLDSLVEDDKDAAHITPVAYAYFEVHNERAENTDYPMFVIEDSDGNLYKTGSSAFFNRFKDIFDTMKADAPDEVFSISIIKRPSTRYKGKYILLCQLD